MHTKIIKDIVNPLTIDMLIPFNLLGL